MKQIDGLVTKDEMYRLISGFRTRFKISEEAGHEMAKRVAEMPIIEAEPDKGWISVKDGMPKLGQRVMAYCRAGILTFLRYDGEVWFEMSSRNEYLLSFVTHWQHLPEPPKGE